MSPLLHADLDSLATGWADGVLRASWQGGAALALAWVLCRVGASWPASLRCWFWRLAFLMLMLALVWTGPVELPLLPPSPALPSHPVPASPMWAPLPSRGRLLVMHARNSGEPSSLELQ